MKAPILKTPASILFFMLLNFLAGSSHAQNDTAFILTEQHKSLGNAQIIQTRDGGFYFVLIDEDSSFVTLDRDVVVVKTDAAYNIQWSNRYYTASHRTLVYGSILLPDGRLCINTFPNVMGYPSGMVPLIIDSTGTINSQINYLSLITYLGYTDCPDGLNYISQHDSSIYVLSSYATPIERVNLLSISMSSGAVLKKRCFNFQDASYDKIIATSDGGVAILGRSYDSMGQGIHFIRVDSSFSTQWWIKLNYTSLSHDLQVFNFVEDASGNFLIYGNLYGATFADRRACIIKVSTNGTVLWSKQTSQRDNIFYTPILFEADSSYYFFYQAPLGGTFYNFIVALDTAGKYQGTRRYKDQVYYDWPHSFTSTSGGKILNGYYLFQGGPQQHCIVMNTDSVVSGSCYGEWSRYPDTISDLPLIFRNYTDTVFHNASPSITHPLFFQAMPINVIRTDLCDFTSVMQQPDGPELIIYPNPIKEWFAIEFDSGIESGDVVIRNIVGQVVLEEQIFHTAVKEISLPQQSPGIYLVTVHADGKIFSKKIIVE